MEPESFRNLVGAACVICASLGIVAGVLWGRSRSERLLVLSRIEDDELRAWGYRQHFLVAIGVIVLGLAFAVTGAYFYGRPYPYSTGTFDPGSGDGVDAITAVGGAIFLGLGSCLLLATTILRFRSRKDLSN